jgi:hypothetical protein
MARKPKSPKPLTSTSAFRAYLREVDDLVAQVDAGRLSKGDAQDRQSRLASVLFTQLGRLFGQRLEQAPAERADVLTIETYPVPLLRGLADGTSYVHPARHPSADPGEPAAGPADTHQVRGHEEGDRFGYPVADPAGGDE